MNLEPTLFWGSRSTIRANQEASKLQNKAEFIDNLKYRHAQYDKSVLRKASRQQKVHVRDNCQLLYWNTNKAEASEAAGQSKQSILGDCRFPAACSVIIIGLYVDNSIVYRPDILPRLKRPQNTFLDDAIIKLRCLTNLLPRKLFGSFTSEDRVIGSHRLKCRLVDVTEKK